MLRWLLIPLLWFRVTAGSRAQMADEPRGSSHFHLSGWSFVIFVCYYIVMKFLMKTIMVRLLNSTDPSKVEWGRSLTVFD